MCPGFNDAHTHFLQSCTTVGCRVHAFSGGLDKQGGGFRGIRGFANQHPENKWIVGCDLNFDSWENGEKPTKELLDELVLVAQRIPLVGICIRGGRIALVWPQLVTLPACPIRTEAISDAMMMEAFPVLIELPQMIPFGLAYVSCDMDRALNASFNEVVVSWRYCRWCRGDTAA